MNQATHAWLAVEAYRKIKTISETAEGARLKLAGLAQLLGADLQNVVVAAWLPDSLIKDMTYGHIFKNSAYVGDQTNRFTLAKKDLKARLPADARTPAAAFDVVPDEWWARAYRVKTEGGHLPARVDALCRTAVDMFKMGNRAVVDLTGIKPPGAVPIADSLLYSPQDIAMTLWMASHYIADAHMPFHCDNRALASTAKQKTHGKVEDIWGDQVPKTYRAGTILAMESDEILGAPLPAGSKFGAIHFGDAISPLKNSGDPWKECVYICRTSFAASFALIPPTVAPVDDQQADVPLTKILTDSVCGEARFWEISRAIMADTISAIAMFWQDAWCDFVKKPAKAPAPGG